MRGIAMRPRIVSQLAGGSASWLLLCVLASAPAPAANNSADADARPARIADPAAMVENPAHLRGDAPPPTSAANGGRPISLAPSIDDAPPEAIVAPLHTETVQFNGIQPGVSTVDDLYSWGDPRATRAKGAGELRVYDQKNFKRVEVLVADRRVQSIVVHFERYYPAEAVAKQLKLGAVRPVAVVDDSGTPIGLSYPERGVTLTYARDKQPNQVAQILLETIDSVPFVLRAENDLYLQPKSALNDLNEALSIDPKLDHALWLKAELLLSVGRYNDALRSIEDALAVDSESLDFRLTRARILETKGERERALLDLKQILAIDGLSASAKAQVQLRLGNCTAAGAKADYARALQAHIAAIKLGESLIKDPNVITRRTAKQILADSYLGAGQDISWGTWQQKAKIVPQWLEKGGSQIEDIVNREAGDVELRLRYFDRALLACAGDAAEMNGDELLKRALQTGQDLLKQTDDPWRKQRVQWEMGLALFQAHEIAQGRGQTAKLGEYAEQAIGYLEKGGRERQVSRDEEYSLGKLYYRLGAIQAVQRKDHVAAMRWYEKAAPLLERPLDDLVPSDLGRYGEIFVSMGVSNWEADKKDEAIRLTIVGAQAMSQAVDSGLLSNSALSVPYGNLANMHKAVGNSHQAEEFQELAEKAAPAGSPKRK